MLLHFRTVGPIDGNIPSVIPLSTILEHRLGRTTDIRGGWSLFVRRKSHHKSGDPRVPLSALGVSVQVTIVHGYPLMLLVLWISYEPIRIILGLDQAFGLMVRGCLHGYFLSFAINNDYCIVRTSSHLRFLLFDDH